MRYRESQVPLEGQAFVAPTTDAFVELTVVLTRIIGLLAVGGRPVWASGLVAVLGWRHAPGLRGVLPGDAQPLITGRSACAGSRLMHIQQPRLDGEQTQFDIGADVEFFAQVFAMGLHGFSA